MENPDCWASQGDWTIHKATIQHLYEQNTLVKVSETMKSLYGFKATIRMYKARIAEWGLDKKNKESEMRAIARKHVHRTEMGKVSAFRVRGKPVNYAVVDRYWKRKGVSINDVVAQRAASKTPETIECCTPVFPPVGTPQVLAIPEGILIMLRDYYRGSFEAGRWIANDPDLICQTYKVSFDPIPRLRRLRAQCRLALDLFERQLPEEARQVLFNATAVIKELVRAEHPRTLSWLFENIIHIRRRGRIEIALIICRQFSRWAEFLLGANHPLTLICGWLVALDQIVHDCFEDVLAACDRIVYECMKDAVGPLHHLLIVSHMNFRGVLLHSDGGSQETSYRKTLSECELRLGRADIRTQRARLDLASDHLSRQKFREARHVAEDMIGQTNSSFFRCCGLQVLADSQYLFGETRAAQQNLLRAIDILRSEMGPYDGLVQNMLLNLEEISAA